MISNIIKKYGTKLLCSDTSGKIVSSINRNRIRSRRFGKFIFDCSNNVILSSTKAAIFWGLYESGELRFIKKYLRSDLDVIELGASLGVASVHIKSIIGKERRLISCEPNPDLIPIINRNMQLNNLTDNFILINSAINYSGKKSVKFKRDKDNLYSRVSLIEENGITIPEVKLSEIIAANQVHNYSLVSDIEGAEEDIINFDKGSFRNCRQIIIEFHNEKNTNDIVSYFLTEGDFRVLDYYGPLFVFQK